MHFQRQPIYQPDDTEHTPAAARALFHLEMLARGFYVARRGFIALSLPLTASDYDAFAAAFDDFLGACGAALA
jgi:glutamate-1-semialdehyde 2,1-aminomutase